MHAVDDEHDTPSSQLEVPKPGLPILSYDQLPSHAWAWVKKYPGPGSSCPTAWQLMPKIKPPAKAHETASSELDWELGLSGFSSVQPLPFQDTARVDVVPLLDWQYTSADYTQVLDDHRVLASVGSVGDALDNAMAESFLDSFKTELIADRVWQPAPNSSSLSSSTSPGLTTTGCTSPSATPRQPSTRTSTPDSSRQSLDEQIKTYKSQSPWNPVRLNYHTGARARTKDTLNKAQLLMPTYQPAHSNRAPTADNRRRCYPRGD